MMAVPVGGKDLNTVVVAIGDIDEPIWVHGDIGGGIQPALPSAASSDLCQWLAVWIEHQHAMIVAVGHKHVTGSVHCDAARLGHSARTGGRRRDLADILAILLID